MVDAAAPTSLGCRPVMQLLRQRHGDALAADARALDPQHDLGDERAGPRRERLAPAHAQGQRHLGRVARPDPDRRTAGAVPEPGVREQPGCRLRAGQTLHDQWHSAIGFDSPASAASSAAAGSGEERLPDRTSRCAGESGLLGPCSRSAAQTSSGLRSARGVLRPRGSVPGST